MLTDDSNNKDWAVIITDVFGEQKLILSYRRREEARAAKKAITKSFQVYKAVVERREIT